MTRCHFFLWRRDCVSAETLVLPTGRWGVVREHFTDGKKKKGISKLGLCCPSNPREGFRWADFGVITRATCSTNKKEHAIERVYLIHITGTLKKEEEGQ